MKKFILVGSGRNGSEYCAMILRACGINCGHQDVFRHGQTLLDSLVNWEDYDGDSSYEAVPMLPMKEYKVILIVRDPLKVINSWVGLGMFGDDMETAFIDLSKVLKKYFPTVLRKKKMANKAGEFFIQWILYAWKNADHVLNIESNGFERDLFKELGYIDKYDIEKIMKISQKQNHRPENDIEIKLEDMSEDIRNEIIKLAGKLGYKK